MKRGKINIRIIVLGGAVVLLVAIMMLLMMLLMSYKSKVKSSNNDIKQANLPEQSETVASTSTPMPTSTPIVYQYKKVVIYKKKLASKHSITNYHSYGNRNVNMKVAGEIINGEDKKGYTLQPGETFSWLKVVGNTTAKKGFKSATVIVNGDFVDGMGGGVCQVASTINSAAIEAGLKTISEPHSESVGYLGPNDHEATVTYDGGKDLKVINTKKVPIRIKVITKGQTVTVKVFKLIKKVKKVKITVDDISEQ